MKVNRDVVFDSARFTSSLKIPTYRKFPNQDVTTKGYVAVNTSGELNVTNGRKWTSVSSGTVNGGGVGIQNTINNGDGSVTFEYTDGTSFTTDVLTGPPGTSITNIIDNGTGTLLWSLSDGTTFETAIPAPNLNDVLTKGNVAQQDIVLDPGSSIITQNANPLILDASDQSNTSSVDIRAGQSTGLSVKYDTTTSTARAEIPNYLRVGNAERTGIYSLRRTRKILEASTIKKVFTIGVGGDLDAVDLLTSIIYVNPLAGAAPDTILALQFPEYSYFRDNIPHFDIHDTFVIHIFNNTFMNLNIDCLTSNGTGFVTPGLGSPGSSFKFSPTTNITLLLTFDDEGKYYLELLSIFDRTAVLASTTNV